MDVQVKFDNIHAIVQITGRADNGEIEHKLLAAHSVYKDQTDVVDAEEFEEFFSKQALQTQLQAAIAEHEEEHDCGLSRIINGHY